ncbi:MAG: DUF1553 domain-containing protein [Planctomycetes bacterium]|nr:DUF1553 domain-containing protein [Planctomycetota bacterium]
MHLTPTRIVNLLLSTAVVLLGTDLGAAELQVEPARVELRDAFARRQLLVSNGGHDVTRRATYLSRQPSIVSVDATGYLVPHSSGTTDVEVTLNGQHRLVPVEVTGFDSLRPVDFATEVEPLLSRFGCNSGGCHGKASGQNGFKLSLFGFDTEFDYHTLVSEGRGRRVMVSAPEQSLLLLKGSGAVPHGGGRRLELGSEPYRLILSWIQSGAPASAANVPHVVKLSMVPAERVMDANEQQQLAVLADYSDGTRRDVTRAAQYSTNLDVVAIVNDDGLVTANEPTGEAAIMTRYMGQVAVCRVLRPQGAPLASLPDFTPRSFVDQRAAEKWKKLGLKPSGSCSDPVFLRRVTIDLCGRLPTVDETRSFLADSDKDKRDKAIERLLAAPDYPAYFALKWGSILRNSNLAGADRASYAFHNWLKDMIARNRPYDEFVRGIVAASGEWADAPAINWFWQSRDDQLHQVTADTAQVFLGLRLQCAKCHHHPYERFTQDDYYGLAGFYTRLGRKSFGEPPPYFTSPSVTIGERHPVTGQPIEPKYLDGTIAKFTAEEDPRHALVDWMARPENPFFSKALVNRLWGHFFGRGLVQEVDDLRETNPPSNPELLEALAREFRDHKFDIKHMIRLMVQSHAYQLSSDPTDDNRKDQQNFARFYARRLPAEVAHDAVEQATGFKTNFSNMSADSRAIDLPHERFGSYFLDTFDRPKRVSGCECERSTSATLSQVLLLSNSDEIEGKLQNGNARIAKLFEAKRSTPEMIEELYLATFSRYPTPPEVTNATSYIERDSEPRKAVEDLLWTLLNSREFLFNH